MKTPAWKKAVSVLCLWGMTFIGGAILIFLWNALTPRMGRYEQGDLGYEILGIISGPVGAYLGYLIMKKWTHEEEKLFRYINFVVLAAALGALLLFQVFAAVVASDFGWTAIKAFISYGASIVTCVVVVSNERTVK